MLKKLLLILLLLFYGQKAQSQTVYRIGLGVGGRYAHWSEIESNGTDNYTYRGDFNFQGGLDLSMDFSDRFGLLTGVYYLNSRFSRTEECVVCEQQEVAQSDYHLNLLQFPLALRYYVLEGKSDFYIQAGIAMHLSLLGSRMYAYGSNTPVKYDMAATMPHTRAVWLAGVGYRYQLTYMWQFFSELSWFQNFGRYIPNYNLKVGGVSLKAGFAFRLN